MQEPVQEGFSCSPQQKHVWRLQQSLGPDAWHTSCAVQIRGTLDHDALRQALTQLVGRHEILRTTFQTLPGTSTPVQQIADAATPELAVHDLRATPEAERAAAVDSRLAATRRESVAHDELPQARFVLLCFADDRHTLLIRQSALCADAVSSVNLVREIAAGYEPGDAAAGDDPLQYADLAEWQNEMFESEDAAQGTAHWSQLEAIAAAGQRLPHEAAVERRDAFHVARLTRAIPDALAAQIGERAAAADVAPSMVPLVAWAILLARLTGAEDAVIRVTSAGRSYEGLDRALGLFEKYLPIRCSAAPAASFGELLTATERTLEEAAEWHEYFDPGRGGADAPRPGFAFEALDPVEDIAAAGVVFAATRREASTDGFSIKLTIEPTPDGLLAHFSYDGDAFTALDVGCIATQFEILLAAACAQPDAPTGTLSMLGDAERQTLLGEFAREPGPDGSDRCIHHLITEQAQRTPDALAVEVDGASLTFGALDRQSNQLARHLQGLGVGPGSIVGLYLDRSVEMITAIVATCKAGGAYLPLPPGYPSERLTFMIEDTAAPVILTRSALAAELPVAHDVVVAVDTCLDELGDAHAEAPQERAGPDDLAYVIFTSGSTGKPKGVLVSHRNLVHSTRARLSYYREPVGRYLLLSSFAFDSSVAGIFWSLCQGGCLVMPREGSEQDLLALVGLIEDGAITHTLALASLYGLILDHAVPAQLASLQAVIVAGEACTAELVRRHAAALPNVGLYNEYGPTENTVWSTVFDCAALGRRPRVPIGRPVPGSETHVLDDQLQPVPIGVAGELYVGGPGVARGYLDRPELTEERFVAHPFGAAGARLYKTGDLARYLADGTLEFLGRADNQVKVRGYRVELGEIENALGIHEAIQECAVLAREDQPGDTRLVAYVTARGEAPAAVDLRAFLARGLPEYMVPSAIMFLEAMPLLPNGKIDRNALPAPGDSKRSTEYLAPRNPVEKVMAHIWGGVLRVDDVGVHDNFFEMGGHSLLVMRVVAEIREQLGAEIALNTVFDKPTVEGLAAEIAAHGDSEAVLRAAEAAAVQLPDDAASA